MSTPSEYRRSIDELATHAIRWWPPTLVDREANASVIPLLVKSLNQFLSLLTLSCERPDQVFDLAVAANFPGNLFLKHLCVLSNVGGESLKRINGNSSTLFPVQAGSGQRVFTFAWKGNEYSWPLRGLPLTGLSNNILQVDGKSLATQHPFSDATKDIAMLLLHGATAENTDLSDGPLAECEIGGMLGESDLLEAYVRESYIRVSRITGGAKANTLGAIAESYIKDRLEALLADSDIVVRSGTIMLSDDDAEVFDIVIDTPTCSIGVEVSFQVTTNSTIERKAKQAELRHKKLRNAGHFMAYVVDGAGNLERRKAITTICNHSDCTVAFSETEFEVLSAFVREHI